MNNKIEGGVILFQFCGGPREGDVVRSDVATDAESTNEAVTLWAKTKGGKLGMTAKVTAGGTLAQQTGNLLELGSGGKIASLWHIYEVTDRADSEREITVTLEFRKTLEK